MQFKVCNTCGKNLPDTGEYFNLRIKKGGIWGTTAKCKSCMLVRHRELREIKRITKLLKGADVNV